MTDEKRLLDDSTTDDALRRALDAGRSEVPSADRLAAIAAKLPPIGPGPGGGGGGGGGAGGGGAGGVTAGAVGGGLPFAAKVALGVVALAAAAGIGAVAIGGGSPSDTGAASASVSASASVAAPASASVAASVSVSVPASASAAASVPSITRPPASALVAAPDPKLDGALVDEAARLVGTDPTTALAKCDEHARLFPKSSVAEERERIAIEALVHLGRRAEAHTRADAFAKRFPGSAYQRRIDALFADGG